jgi:peptidoglycan/LPS O-acetylase OafA/YrhL
MTHRWHGVCVGTGRNPCGDHCRCMGDGTITYRPQLDALRAIAVSGVLVGHYWLQVSPFAHLGVRLFFVLSGFLITTILLQGGSPLAFYGRRAARLWPAFYLCLALALFLDLDGYRATWMWHAAQASNVLMTLRGSWGVAWPAVALWSLNVEEQFYLVWPIVIAVTPRRALPAVLGCIVVVGPLYRILAVSHGFNEVATYTLPPASMDALGAGALMAAWPHKFIVWLGAACTPFLILALLPVFDSRWSAELIECGLVPVFCALVLSAYRGAFKPLQWPPLPALGRMSYGVYLYHLPVLAVALRLGVAGHGPATLVVGSIATLAVAWLSYSVIERPIREAARRGLKRAISAAGSCAGAQPPPIAIE